jgi:hypothetical protein
MKMIRDERGFIKSMLVKFCTAKTAGPSCSSRIIHGSTERAEKPTFRWPKCKDDMACDSGINSSSSMGFFYSRTFQA